MYTNGQEPITALAVIQEPTFMQETEAMPDEVLQEIDDTDEIPTQTCDQCGHNYPEDDLIEVGDQSMCRDCADECAFLCDHCGDMAHIDDAVRVGEDLLCEDCANDHTSICSQCGDRIYDEDVYYVDDEVVCGHCLDHSYDIRQCAACGESHFENNMDYDDEDEEYYCTGCAPDRDLHSYHCGIPLHFYGEGKYHMGVELEVDSPNGCGDRAGSAQEIIGIMDGHVYCEKDSSLDCGFEIITHPHTYEELLALPWERTLSALVADGWRGHDVNTAGLHVHIGRNCFDDEDAITRFCTFFENNWAFVKAFSRRTDRQLADYAARYFEDDDDDCGHMKYSASEVKAKTEESRDRYRAVNLTNDSTIEVRVFRSTLKYSSFMAALELVHLLAERSNQITDHEAETMTVSEWLQGASDTLRAYCAGRGYALTAQINTENNTESEAA